jgi:transposase
MCAGVAAEQSEEFQSAIKIVVIDPSAPYASGIRAALPDAKIAVDKWHLVALANQMVTEVRHASPATCSVGAARSPIPSG